MKSLTVLALLLIALPAHAQHEGHGQAPVVDHSQHQMPATREPAPTNSPLPEPTPEERAAAFPDLGEMDMRDHMVEDPLIAVLRVDQLEWNQHDALGWNLRASIGGTFDKLMVRSEGEKPSGERAHGNAEVLWSHATGPWWDRVIGVRSDFGWRLAWWDWRRTSSRWKRVATWEARAALPPAWKASTKSC